MQAIAGAVFSSVVVSKASQTVIDAGSIIVSSASSLTTTNQLLTITTDSTLVLGDVNSGTAITTIKCRTGGTNVGLGAIYAELQLDQNGLQHLSNSGLVVGGSMCGNQAISNTLQVHRFFCYVYSLLWVYKSAFGDQAISNNCSYKLTRSSLLLAG